ncbi:MAG: DNA polymerase/3'-5' exonuclease PolX [Desulfobacterales bacterium]|nr:MAG: DNA polymerase/3'-5' exonuclease PolX [Desulfobacterales bacterium]
MPIHNADIADVFDEIADCLEIDGANPFRVRAYRNAARTVRGLGVELRDLVAQDDDLTRLPGIGKDLAAKIQEILVRGTAQALEKLRARIPPTLTEILKIPNLGPKRVRVLFQELKIQTLEQLREAAQKGDIRQLPGFGAQTERHILEAVEARATKAKRIKLAVARSYVDSLIDYLKKVPGVEQVVAAGSYRRCQETVGDLDILVTARQDSPVMARFVQYDEVKEILSQGRTRSSVVLVSGLQVDLRRVEQASFGAALQYFTGSQAHNIAIRRMGIQRGLKINEYGVFRLDQRVAGATEESVYRALGLPYIPPELRESRGEIEAAGRQGLPKLIELSDIKGDLHVHTNATDGRFALKEMALAAADRGLQYIAITDHSDQLKVAGGLTPSQLRRQLDEIDRLNEELPGITILKGIEAEILKDGRLDLPEKIAAELDLVIGSVHSHFALPLPKQTERILRAMDHPHFTILAHPTGRLIDERDPYAVDMGRIIAKARERGCYLELNASPKRLDLLDIYCQVAREEGVRVAINSDAHGIDDFDNLIYGVGQARRGWLGRDDVLNTRDLAELRRLLKDALVPPAAGKTPLGKPSTQTV